MIYHFADIDYTMKLVDRDFDIKCSTLSQYIKNTIKNSIEEFTCINFASNEIKDIIQKYYNEVGMDLSDVKIINGEIYLHSDIAELLSTNQIKALRKLYQDEGSIYYVCKYIENRLREKDPIKLVNKKYIKNPKIVDLKQIDLRKIGVFIAVSDEDIIDYFDIESITPIHTYSETIREILRKRPDFQHPIINIKTLMDLNDSYGIMSLLRDLPNKFIHKVKDYKFSCFELSSFFRYSDKRTVLRNVEYFNLINKENLTPNLLEMIEIYIKENNVKLLTKEQ